MHVFLSMLYNEITLVLTNLESITEGTKANLLQPCLYLHRFPVRNRGEYAARNTFTHHPQGPFGQRESGGIT